MKCVVQLRYAPVPYLGAFASHYWFVVFDQAKGECHRWEVWQTRNAGGWSLGHVHCNLKHPDDGVGAGPYRLAAEWNGAQALALRAIPSPHGCCAKRAYSTPAIARRSAGTTRASGYGLDFFQDALECL